MPLLTDLRFRRWRAADREAGFALFDGNVPDFFAIRERADFSRFLDAIVPDYFVLEDEGGRVVACGGYEEDETDPSLAVFCWGMVARGLHRRGLGERLARERLTRIAANPRFAAVILDTTPMSQGFFERLGFVATKVTADGYAPGYDRVEMRLELAAWRGA
jgi:Acetyltransferase (GNAT) family.